MILHFSLALQNTLQFSQMTMSPTQIFINFLLTFSTVTMATGPFCSLPLLRWFPSENAVGKGIEISVLIFSPQLSNALE